MAILRDDRVAGDDMVQALAVNARHRRPLTDVQLARALLPTDDLHAALARHWKTSVIDLARNPPDICLIDRMGADQCLRRSLIPWRQVGDVIVIVTALPEDFMLQRDQLTQIFGRIAMAIAPRASVEACIFRLRGKRLVQLAETRVADHESCCNLAGGRLLQPVLCGLVLAGFSLFVWPMGLLWVMTGWSVLTLLLCSLLKVAAGFAACRRQPTHGNVALIAHKPVVSVMVALFRESDIAPRLVRRLARLDYPREGLDILLVVEAEDMMTRSALARSDLPDWMRVIVVPDGAVRTKPRALNFALNHCRGSIVGVYDAEDAPAPDQITRVVQRFYQRGPEVACVQGMLDFYNPMTNWVSRCFTIEYATWFRLLLPGLERLGLPIPLGGTTLFFRRNALEAVGAWDAHNVTEDADLGMRLYRHGYRTELIDSVTAEEANCRTIPWIKQRSRWIKGYMMTWATHMRNPRLLLAQLGWWRFAGFQVLLLCTLSQFLLAPVLWSFWLPWLGLPHPVADALPPGMAFGLLALLLGTGLVNLTLNLVGLHLTGHRMSRLWALVMHLYFPLGALASYKAAWEMFRKPFYWDKTTHGHFDPPEN